MTDYKTEAEVYSALVKLFPPPAYAVLPGVANTTGGKRSRAIDAIVMSLWPSRGLTIEAVEIKVSRGDYLRELRNPAKAEPIIKYCDRFWIAVGDETIVQGDLPTTWGLLAPGRAGKLEIVKQAPTLTPSPVDRGFLASIMRRANEALEGGEIKSRIRADVESELADRMAVIKSNAMSPEVTRELERLRQMAKNIETFEKISGVRFSSWSDGSSKVAGEIVRAINESGAERVISRAKSQLENARGSGQRLMSDATRGISLLDGLTDHD